MEPVDRPKAAAVGHCCASLSCHMRVNSFELPASRFESMTECNVQPIPQQFEAVRHGRGLKPGSGPTSLLTVACLTQRF